MKKNKKIEKLIDAIYVLYLNYFEGISALFPTSVEFKKLSKDEFESTVFVNPAHIQLLFADAVNSDNIREISNLYLSYDRLILRPIKETTKMEPRVAQEHFTTPAPRAAQRVNRITIFCRNNHFHWMTKSQGFDTFAEAYKDAEKFFYPINKED